MLKGEFFFNIEVRIIFNIEESYGFQHREKNIMNCYCYYLINLIIVVILIKRKMMCDIHNFIF